MGFYIRDARSPAYTYGTRRRAATVLIISLILGLLARRRCPTTAYCQRLCCLAAIGEPLGICRDCADCSVYLDAFDCLCPEACAGKNRRTQLFIMLGYNIMIGNSHDAQVTRHAAHQHLRHDLTYSPSAPIEGWIVYRLRFVCLRLWLEYDHS